MKPVESVNENELEADLLAAVQKVADKHGLEFQLEKFEHVGGITATSNAFERTALSLSGPEKVLAGDYYLACSFSFSTVAKPPNLMGSLDFMSFANA
jgi:hypothetical protein